MDNVNTISSLRLRASYGVNGTLPPDEYGWRSLTSYSSNYMELPGSGVSTIADANWKSLTEPQRTFYSVCLSQS